MDDFSATLNRLSLTFTVKDIMTGMDQLVTAPDVEAARILLQREDSYDVIPIKKDGELKAYLERGKQKEKYIDLRELCSDATSILELVDILKSRHFIFILSGQRVAGYVHFSDLNKQIVRLPYYVLFEAVERRLKHEIGEKISEAIIRSAFKADKLQEIIDRMEKLRSNNVDLGWANILYFGEILQISKYFGLIQIRQADIQLLNKFRNRIAHSDGSLIRNYGEVPDLSKTWNLCQFLLTGFKQAAI